MTLKTDSELFHALTKIQDEVHRYAISFHRDKRSKHALHSELDNISGIGKKSAEALLRRFKSVKRIREADIEAIAEVVGKVRAEALRRHSTTRSEQPVHS